MNSDTPPSNIEAEESILGGILLDKSAIGRVIGLLTPESFFCDRAYYYLPSRCRTLSTRQAYRFN